jgi:hypothetical protein
VAILLVLRVRANLQTTKCALSKSSSGIAISFKVLLNKKPSVSGLWMNSMRNTEPHSRLVYSSSVLGVLAHETWLDTQVGNKGALRWTGPFIIHEKVRDKTYKLRELDGTVKRELYFATRLKIFYYREHYQTVRSAFPEWFEVRFPCIDWRERRDWRKETASLTVTTNDDSLDSYRVIVVKGSYTDECPNPDLIWSPVLEHAQQTPGRVTRLRKCPPIKNLTDPWSSHLLGILAASLSARSAPTVIQLDPRSLELEQLEDWTCNCLPLR